jgi:pimeloyl-ACP methyl ester carboxylesterase
MDYVASRGFNVFALSIRGYGLSTKPPELRQPRLSNPPTIRGRVAVRDIGTAVEYICEKLSIDKLNLTGWSWGSTTTAAYTAGHGNRIRRLALYAPFYAYDRPEVAAQSEDPNHPGRIHPKFGAWRWVTEREQEERWGGSIPRGLDSKWREARAAKKYWTAQLQYDPIGKKRRIPAVCVPNGAKADGYDRARNKPIYDASNIHCPVLLIRGDHDRSCNDPEVAGHYKALCNSREKRSVLLGGGTHFMQYERRREELFQQVQIFIEA